MDNKLFFFLIFLFYSTTCYSENNNHSAKLQTYPSIPIKRILFDWSTLKKEADGSDNFPVTWADDDCQYVAWGDGWGFERKGNKCSLGLSKISGAFENPVYKDVWHGKGKSYGIICIDSVLYMWVGPGSNFESCSETKLYQSFNHGKSWNISSWQFDSRICIPTFLQFGKNYQGARDEYVYIYAPEVKKPEFGIWKPGEFSLWRVNKNRLMERNAYNFLAGFSESKPLWTSDFNKRTPIFNQVSGAGNVSVSFNKVLKRYLLITTHSAFANGNIAIYESPEPWGPWTCVLFEKEWGKGYIENTTFFWNFSNKWLSNDGKEFVLIFTGIRSNDAYCAIKGRFITEE